MRVRARERERGLRVSTDSSRLGRDGRVDFIREPLTTPTVREPHGCIREMVTSYSSSLLYLFLVPL